MTESAIYFKPCISDRDSSSSYHRALDLTCYSPPFTCLTGVWLERGAKTTLNGRELFFYTLDPYQKASQTKKSVAKFGLSRLLFGCAGTTSSPVFVVCVPSLSVVQPLDVGPIQWRSLR